MPNNPPPPAIPPCPDETPELQREVQRLLGRCILRLQQYERLIKAVLAHHELAGPAHLLEKIRDKRVQDWKSTTLGLLTGKLLDSFVVQDGVERKLLADDIANDMPHFGSRTGVLMAADDYARTRGSLEELVELRNGLVHHFIEQYDDLWQPDGCAAAREHLLTCHTRIDGHFEQVRAWAEGMEQAQRHLTSFMQSPAVHDLMVNGISPDGTVDWSSAGCVETLREAIDALAVDGWVSVDAAADWISTHHPDQTPEKYGCRTWRQMIHESRRFDLRYREEDGRKVAWYRERSSVANPGR